MSHTACPRGVLNAQPYLIYFALYVPIFFYDIGRPQNKEPFDRLESELQAEPLLNRKLDYFLDEISHQDKSI